MSAIVKRLELSVEYTKLPRARKSAAIKSKAIETII